MNKQNNNNAPFYVGQKVVALFDLKGFTAVVKKGAFFTVKKIWYCCKVVGYRISIGVADNNSSNYIFKCEDCHTELHGEYWMAEHFAPIEPRHQDVEIAQELLVEPAPEVLDAPIKKPEPAVAN